VVRTTKPSTLSSWYQCLQVQENLFDDPSYVESLRLVTFVTAKASNVLQRVLNPQSAQTVTTLISHVSSSASHKGITVHGDDALNPLRGLSAMLLPLRITAHGGLRLSQRSPLSLISLKSTLRLCIRCKPSSCFIVHCSKHKLHLDLFTHVSAFLFSTDHH